MHPSNINHKIGIAKSKLAQTRIITFIANVLHAYIYLVLSLVL